MPQPTFALSFRMFQNGQLIREDTLTQGVIKIGKVPSAHLQIADDGVSRMHAIIEVTGREVHLIDLGSTRGTFVNGKKINKARLETGDAITVGDTRIEIAIGDTASAPGERSSDVANQTPSEPLAARAGARTAAPPPSIPSTAPPPILSSALPAPANPPPIPSATRE